MFFARGKMICFRFVVGFLPIMNTMQILGYGFQKYMIIILKTYLRRFKYDFE